jgi:hypothetical protein
MQYLIKSQFIFLMYLSIFSIGCNDDNCDDAEMTYLISNAEITLDTSLALGIEIVDGDNLVFDFEHKFRECKDVNDDERYENVYFQIDKTVVELYVTDEDLLRYNCYYRQSGAWGTTIQLIETGTLQADKRNDNEWDVQATFLIQDNDLSSREITINDTYTAD